MWNICQGAKLSSSVLKLEARRGTFLMAHIGNFYLCSCSVLSDCIFFMICKRDMCSNVFVHLHPNFKWSTDAYSDLVALFVSEGGECDEDESIEQMTGEALLFLVTFCDGIFPMLRLLL